jgi:hypothetical protein
MQPEQSVNRKDASFVDNKPSTPTSIIEEAKGKTILESNLYGINLDEEYSDSDRSEVEEDQSESNPYFSIINSDLPREKPPNWYSIVLFNGRLKLSDLPANLSKPQLDDGSLLPQIREVVKTFIALDGTLQNCPTTLTMETPVIDSSSV